MGVNDKVWFRVSCPKCGVSETASVADKGSTWGGPSWSSFPTFETFEVGGHGGTGPEPELTAAKCNRCGGPAVIQKRYGFGPPKGF